MNWKEQPVGTALLRKQYIKVPPSVVYVCLYNNIICLSYSLKDTKTSKIVGNKFLPNASDVFFPMVIEEDITEWL